MGFHDLFDGPFLQDGEHHALARVGHVYHGKIDVVVGRDGAYREIHLRIQGVRLHVLDGEQAASVVTDLHLGVLNLAVVVGQPHVGDVGLVAIVAEGYRALGAIGPAVHVRVDRLLLVCSIVVGPGILLVRSEEHESQDREDRDGGDGYQQSFIHCHTFQ